MTQFEALALTLAVEIPVVVGLARYFGLRDHPGRVAAIAAAASLVTHPLAWFLSAATTASLPFWGSAALIETAVIAAETFIYRQALGISTKHALLFSLTANALSFGAGLAIYWYL